MSTKFRLDLKPPSVSKQAFCRVLARNIEDYKRLGYDSKALEDLYGRVCG